MKLFVTGGAGFIGSNFIHYILAKHPRAEICNFDALTYAGNLDNLRGIPETRYSFVKGNINNFSELRAALSDFQPEFVVHLAAESHVDRSIEDPQVFLETNILGTENVLRAVKNLKIPRLIHMSTDEVYGSLLEGEAAEDCRFDPNSPYSASKASGDMLCRAYFVTYGVPVIVLRGSNCYGPRQYPEKLIPKAITNIVRGLKMGVYGDGKNVREWTYTEDFCAGIEIAMLTGKLGGSYNLGSSVRTNNNVIVTNICTSLNRNPAESIEYVADRQGHDRRYALNNTKLRSLGWEPKYSLSKGIEETVQWYTQNEWWWHPLI